MAVQQGNFGDAPDFGPENTLLFNGNTGLYHPHLLHGDVPGTPANVQYANLFHEQDPDMLPGAIFYARDEDDVVAVLKYAADKKTQVAVRTGGHQYSGGSSTSSKNILLDLSRCKVKEEVIGKSRETITIRMGVNKDLLALNEWLCHDHGAFVPHGHCAHVHLGGHVQTGGYGHAVRAFGLLADHVVGMRVYTADGEAHDLYRHALDNAADRDLFFAMLGGSPGNFGVLVRVDLRAVRASAHPNARGMKLFSLYTKKTLQKLLRLLAAWSDDDDLPAGFDYTVTVIGAGRRDMFARSADGAELPFPQEAKDAAAEAPPHPDAQDIFQKLGFDDDSVDDFFREAAALEPSWEPSSPWLAYTVVWVQWANLGGAAEEFSPDMEQRFEAIRHAGLWPCTQMFDAHLAGQDLAHMSLQWAFPIQREFHLPYHKRCHATTRNNLAASDYAHFVPERLSAAVGLDNWLKGLRVVMQTQLYGGKASAFTTGDSGDLSCHAWRRDMRAILVMDAFYRDDLASGEPTAREWVQQNTAGLLGHNGCFSSEDLRVLWGSFENDPAELNLNANAVWPFYFRDAATVERLRKTKATVDPDGLLTPNSFCIRPL